MNVLLSSTDTDHLRHFLERLLQCPFTVIPFSRPLFEKVAQKCQPSEALAKAFDAQTAEFVGIF